MSDLVDCRGLSCPEPVIRVREAIKQETGNKIVVKVSNAVARDNVSRTARAMGWVVNSEDEDQDFVLTLTK